ncbi:transposase [Gluconobacter cerinus]|uniref:transposase n=1 Tax=Gluconobacter cerinus TaxID=38307 RepID=UPI001FCE88F9|nr:transposase [Gluconobacter cerinus]
MQEVLPLSLCACWCCQACRTVRVCRSGRCCPATSGRTLRNATSRRRSNRRVTTRYERTLYNQRYRIELMFGRLKINCALATRYDQLAASFMSMVHISTARYWLKFVHVASPINL